MNTFRSWFARSLISGLMIAVAALLNTGCAVVAVADLAVTTVSTVVSTGVKATGAVIDAVIPDSAPKK
jgi:hypothetical protein